MRVQGEKWYPVKCDMVAKQAVLDRTATDDKTLSRTVCENFSKDNQAEGIDFTVTKVPWLSKADYKKKVGSLVIWLKSKFAADHLLKAKFVGLIRVRGRLFLEPFWTGSSAVSILCILYWNLHHVCCRISFEVDSHKSLTTFTSKH